MRPRLQIAWEQLTAYSIVSSDDLLKLKQFIRSKYPVATASRQAAILANAVHRQVDRHLPETDEATRLQLQDKLLRLATVKTPFSIVAYDVLISYFQVAASKASWLPPLKIWLENYGISASEFHIINYRMSLLLPNAEGLPTGSESPTKRPWRLLPPLRPISLWTRDHLAAASTSLLCAVMAVSLLTPTLRASDHIPAAGFPSLPNASIDETSNVHISPLAANELPSAYQYHDIRIDQIQRWLGARKSKLAEEPYLSAIVASARQYNIHPLLLLAVAGQEQGLVPVSHPKAEAMANNPFNVYRSWKDYNTDIADSSQIAAKTIVNLSNNRPDGTPSLEWVNRKYAEDPNWHVGVERYFQMLVQADEESVR